MAGSVTTYKDYYGEIGYKTLIWEWTSDASGDVSGVGAIVIPSGTLTTFLSVPSGDTDAWDLVIPATITYGSSGSVTVADILDGEGANLSNSTDGEWKTLSNPFAIPFGRGIKTSIVPTISNAGNAQSGVLMLQFWKEK